MLVTRQYFYLCSSAYKFVMKNPQFLKNKQERGHKGVDKRFCFGCGFANEL